jgi:hypothetical protein
MIVILASRWDEHAHTLAQRWAPAGARLMTPRDLSRPGWRLHTSETAAAQTAVIAGELVPHHQITAVLNRLPGILEDELAHILPSDRTYIVSEMEAFLTFWLSRLTCPVLNRPQPNCLVGPAWSLERWACLAAQTGIPVQPLHLPPPPGPAPNETSVTVVGSQSFGEPDCDPALHAHALRLAAAAQLDLLEVRFTQAHFSGINLIPDLLDDTTAVAVLQTLTPPLND